MSTECQTSKKHESSETKKPNFFQKMFFKLDEKMKAKAEQSSSCCCCDEDKESTEESKKCC